MDLATQARNLAQEIATRRAEASTAWTSFTGLRDSAVREGVDLTQGGEAFDALDRAGADYDRLRDEVATLEARHAGLLRAMGRDGQHGTGPGARGGDGSSVADPNAPRGWGSRYTSSEEYQNARERVALSGAPLGATAPIRVADRTETIAAIRNAILTGTVTGGAGGSGGDALFESRQPGIVGIPQAPLNVLDLINVSEVDERVVSWVVETLFDNNAAETAENALKPETSFGFDTVDATVRDIAHWTKVTRQMFRDVAALEGWINQRMAYGVRRRLQRQVLIGDGAGVNLLGLYNQPGIVEVDPAADDLWVSIHKAITTVRTSYFDSPNAVLLNPTDWQDIRLGTDNNGNYFYGGPAGMLAGDTVWGLRVALSVDVPAGNPMVGFFPEATLWVREGLTVASTDSNEDDFKYNRIMVRAEMAGAFGVTQPAAFAVVRAPAGP